MNGALTPGRFAQALQEERESKRRRTLILWGIGIGLAVILAVGVWLAFFSQVLAVKDVAVGETTLLTREQILETAAVELDVPMLATDTDAIAARVAELPAVLSVAVERDFPDTIVISVVERELAYQRPRAGQVDWVDPGGVVFHQSAEPTPGAIQVISDTSEHRLLTDIATVAVNIPESVRPQVISLTAESVDRMTISLTQNRTVEWGSAEESELKGDVIEALLTVEAKVYDVSAPQHPTTR